jgi:hypothetical protein
METMETVGMVFGFAKLILEDVVAWFSGKDSVLDYDEFAKRAGGKFKSELLLEREKNRIKAKKRG